MSSQDPNYLDTTSDRQLARAAAGAKRRTGFGEQNSSTSLSPRAQRRLSAYRGSGGSSSRVSPQDDLAVRNMTRGAGTAAEEASTGAFRGARISPTSFSAGSADNEGRVQDSVTQSSSNVVKSLRDNWRGGSGATNRLSLLSEGSVMDGGILGRNRQETFKASQPRASAKPVSAFREFDPSKPQDTANTYNDPNSPYFEANGNERGGEVDERGGHSNMLGGEVDTAQYLSYAMAEGLGDSRLTQAAMKSFSDPGKKYKNLRSMGVV